jgi:hypothetical protein
MDKTLINRNFICEVIFKVKTDCFKMRDIRDLIKNKVSEKEFDFLNTNLPFGYDNVVSNKIRWTIQLLLDKEFIKRKSRGTYYLTNKVNKINYKSSNSIFSQIRSSD